MFYASVMCVRGVCVCVMAAGNAFVGCLSVSGVFVSGGGDVSFVCECSCEVREVFVCMWRVNVRRYASEWSVWLCMVHVCVCVCVCVSECICVWNVRT